MIIPSQAGPHVSLMKGNSAFTRFCMTEASISPMPDDSLYGYAHLLTERMLFVHAPAMSEAIGSAPGAQTLASLPLIAYDEELPLIRALWAVMFQKAPEMQAAFTIADLRIIRE